MASNLETCVLTLIVQTAKFFPFPNLKTFLNFVKWVYELQNFFILSDCVDSFKKYGKILIKLFLLITRLIYKQPESKIASKTEEIIDILNTKGMDKDACKNEITQGFFNSTVQLSILLSILKQDNINTFEGVLFFIMMRNKI